MYYDDRGDVDHAIRVDTFRNLGVVPVIANIVFAVFDFSTPGVATYPVKADQSENKVGKCQIGYYFKSSFCIDSSHNTR